MELPIDITKLTFIVGGPPEPVLDFDTGAQRKSPDGAPLFQVDMMVTGRGRPEVVRVRTAKEPKGLAQGAVVTPAGLVIIPWSRNGKNGVSYNAASVEAARATGSTS